jgi:hypothetical protein
MGRQTKSTRSVDSNAFSGCYLRGAVYLTGVLSKQPPVPNGHPGGRTVKKGQIVCNAFNWGLAVK